jgi:signal transduction histidine kinase
VKTLEQVARRVSGGRLGERVPASLIADRDLVHLAHTMNHMLDTLSADRQRICQLAAEVVYAQEKERAQVARDLDDSVAQTLAAASFQVAAAGSGTTANEVKSHLVTIHELLRTALQDIRSVSKSLHPRVAVDLGLPEALRALAASTRQRSLIDVRVNTKMDQSPIPAAISTTLYRVAQEALRNIEMVADAGSAVVSLSSGPGIVELEVSDDGSGLDNAVERMRSDPVLNRMRQRLSLVGGDLHIQSTRDCGTRVIARAALTTEAA